MQARVVPLASEEAGEARVGGTASERVALVLELSRMLWTRTGRSNPTYTRATMPIVITTLDEQSPRA